MRPDDHGAGGLRVDAKVLRADLEVRPVLAVAPGEVVALVGPNGAGKSTVLDLVAGLVRADAGRVLLGDRVLDAGPGGEVVHAEARRVGLVAQGLALFPHRSAAANVAYGPRARGAARREATERARRELDAVGIDASTAARRPGALSGGEAQRVALARALAVDPDVLLLDEPLSAVDARARGALLRTLRARLAAFAGPALVVVHDVRDALALADRIVVLEAGRVVQSGAPADLARAPRTTYVADLVGLNGYAGVADGAGGVRVGAAALRTATELIGDVVVTVHPRAVSLFPDRPEGSPRNAWAMTVRAVQPTLERVRVELEGALPIVAEVTASAAGELDLAPGRGVWATVKATEIAVTQA